MLRLDETDTRILEVLQTDGRISMTELGRAISLSAAATTERVRRLEEAGIIEGYRASINTEALGYGIAAFVRLKYPHGNYKPMHDLLARTPEVTSAHHVTGADCFVLQVIAHSMAHLERVTGRLAGLGSITTSIVYSSALQPRSIKPYTPKDTDAPVLRSL